MASRRKGRLSAMLLALVAVFSLTACGGPNFDALKDDLKFGDEEIADTQTVYSMKIPKNGVGKLIRSNQIAYAKATWANAINPYFNGNARKYLASVPANQCVALANTYQEETPDAGPWNWNAANNSCDKTRKLSWLEKTMWTMYEQQSDDTIEWLSTTRNTLVAAPGTVDTLQNSILPMYDTWDTNVNKYLNVAQAVLVVAAAISLMILAARIIWQIGNGSAGMDGHLLGRIGWIFLGVFMGSSAASIALTFFKQANMTRTVVNGVPTATAGRSTPALTSWTPGAGTSFFVSDWVRLQVDPFLIIAAVCGVIAAGFKLITTQEGRDLVPLGKAFMWSMLTSVCLAGFVNLFQGTVDTWTAGMLRSASDMMKSAWSHNTLAASEFFNLDWPIALVLTIVMWFCNLISKVFCYLRAGLLPILVGIAPVWAAMSWMETGRQAFGKVMGWLFAFLMYKPVAALVMATGCAIMTTAGAGDDSQAITLMLTISVIVLLPAMIRLIVPSVAGSIGGGGVIPSMLGGMAGMGVMAAGGVLKAGAKGVMGATGALSGKVKPSVPNGAKRAVGSGENAGASGIGSGISAPGRPGSEVAKGGGETMFGGSSMPDGTRAAGSVPKGAVGSSASNGVKTSMADDGTGSVDAPSGGGIPAAPPSSGSGGVRPSSVAQQPRKDVGRRVSEPSAIQRVRAEFGSVPDGGPHGANRSGARKTKEF